MLDLKRLRVFREVCRRGSFSEAAFELNYSQPAVSHHIARLELEVGAKLLERPSRGKVFVTPTGEVLLRHAEDLLARLASAEDELGALVVGREPVVRLGAFATASATIVANAIATYRERHGDIHLTLIEGEAPAALDDLMNGRIDIAVVFDDPNHALSVDTDRVELRYLYTDPMLLLMPVHHPLADGDAVELTALRDEAWIEGAGAETPCSLILTATCQEVGFEPKIAFSSGNYQVVPRLVAAGVGVALVPELALGEDVPGVVVCPLRLSTPHRRIGLAVSVKGYRSPAFTAMLDALEGSFASYVARQTPTDQARIVGAR